MPLSTLPANFGIAESASLDLPGQTPVQGNLTDSVETDSSGTAVNAQPNARIGRQQQLRNLQISLGPSPCVPGQTGFLSAHQDNGLGVQLQKLNDNAFLYKGRIIRFDATSHQYVDLQSRPADWTKLRIAGERDHDVLDITQGEIGMIAAADAGMKTLRTTGASPCVTVIVRNTETCKTLMAHFHRYNNIDDLMQKVVKEFGAENMDLEVSLFTKTYDGEHDEEGRQAQIMNSLNQRFNDTFDYLVTLRESWNEENVAINVESGEITHPRDEEIDSDKGTIAAVRALAIETAWNQQPVDNSKGFVERTANLMEQDASVFAEAPLLAGAATHHRLSMQ